MKINFQKLNKRLTSIFLALSLFIVFCSPLGVLAEVPTKPIDYTELDYIVKEGPIYNEITVPIDPYYYDWSVYNDKTGQLESTIRGEADYNLLALPNSYYKLFVFPVSSLGLSLRNIPEGSKLTFDILVGVSGEENYYVPTFSRRSYYTTASNVWITPVKTVGISGKFWQKITLTYDITDIPENAANFVPSLSINNFMTAFGEPTEYEFTISTVSLVMQVSTGHWEQWLSKQTGKQIDELGNRIVLSIDDNTNEILEGNEYLNDIAGDSNHEMSAAADKLDNLGGLLNSVEKPDVNTFQIGLGDMIGDSASIPMLTAPIKEIWENPVALGILTIVVTLVLVSWVFFGKKK